MLGHPSAQNPTMTSHMVQSKARALLGPARHTRSLPSLPNSDLISCFSLLHRLLPSATAASPLFLRLQEWASTSGFCTCLFSLAQFRPSQRAPALAGPLNPTPDSFYSPPCFIFSLSLPNLLKFYKLCLCFILSYWLSFSRRQEIFVSFLHYWVLPLPQTVPGTQLFNRWVNTPGSGSGSLVRAQKRKVVALQTWWNWALEEKKTRVGGGEPRKQAPRDEGLPYGPQDFLSIWHTARPQQPLGNIVAMNTLSLDWRNLKKEWGKNNQSCWFQNLPITSGYPGVCHLGAPLLGHFFLYYLNENTSNLVGHKLWEVQWLPQRIDQTLSQFPLKVMLHSCLKI